jgi:hypothetical protein
LFVDEHEIITKTENDIQQTLCMLDVICKEPYFKMFSVETKIMALKEVDIIRVKSNHSQQSN